MRAALLLVATSACFSPDPPRGLACSPSGECPDGQMCMVGICGGAAGTDAGSDPGPPDLGVHFGAPTIVGGQRVLGDQFGPSLTGDQALMFTSGQDVFGALGIYSSTSTTNGFTIPQAVMSLSAIDDAVDPEISLDGQTIVFTSKEMPSGIWYAVKNNQGFTNIDSVLPGKVGPGLAASDSRLFCNDATTTAFEEYASSLDNGVTMLRTHTALMGYQYPSGSYDGLEVFTMRNHIIFRATRASLDDEFGDPMRVTFDGFEDSDKDDPEISQDGTTLYFSMKTTESLGYDTYMATR